MSEIEFFTDYLKPGTVVIYAGAAPATHVLCLLDMFSDYEFVLIDPAPFSPRLIAAASCTTTRTRLTLINSFFTAELAAYYASLDVRKLFVCDIRSGDPKMPAFEESVAMDMAMQMGWHVQLGSEASMLKFRLPYAPGKTCYLDGTIFLPVWGPRTTTECRLVARKGCGTKIYDNTQYEELMSFFNHCIRGSVYPHPYTENSCGLDHCYDCAAEIYILSKYIRVMQPECIEYTAAQLSHRINRSLGDTLHCNRFSSEEKVIYNLRTQGITPSPYSAKLQLQKEFTIEKYLDLFLKCNTIYTEYGALQRALPVLSEEDMKRLAPGLNLTSYGNIMHEVKQLLHEVPFHYTILKISMMAQHAQLRQLRCEEGRSVQKFHEFPEALDGSRISRLESVEAYPMDVPDWRAYWRSVYDICVSNPKLVTRPLHYVASADIKHWILGEGQYTNLERNWKLSSATQTSPSKEFATFDGMHPSATFVEGTENDAENIVSKPCNVLFDASLTIVNQYLDLHILSNVGATKCGESVHPWSGRKYPIVGVPVPSGSFAVRGDYAAGESIHANAEKFMQLILADFTFAHYVTLHALNTIFVSNLEAATVAYEYLGHYVRVVGKAVVKPAVLSIPTLNEWKGENYFYFSDFI
jgi:hypothetical protein